jgi:hypothetical protein
MYQSNERFRGGDSVGDGEQQEEEPTMIVRVLSVPPPHGLAFRFADGHVEAITEMAAVTGETYVETLERVARELGADVVAQVGAHER